MNRVNYTNEINKTINAKIYYKSETQVELINLDKNYKIKQIYLSEQKNKLLQLFVCDLNTPLLCKTITNFLNNNYHEPDMIIYEQLMALVTSVMPDINVTYLSNIKKYINT